MKISGVGSANQGQPLNMSNQTDGVSRNIQKQIADAQKELQELSKDDSMSAEEKMKKRQEIQKRISDLNQQLRQHEIDIKREEQQKKKSAAEESQPNMQSLLAADTAMNQAKIQGSVAGKMQGKADVLEVEIKLDSERGGTVELKQKELTKLQEKAQNAQVSQADTLGEVNRAIKEQNQPENVKDKEDKEEEDKEKKNSESKETEVKSYTEEGKPVKEEPDPVIFVQI